MEVITETTSLSLGLIMAVVGISITIVGGGIYWFTQLYSLTKSNKQRIDVMETEVKQIRDFHRENSERMSIIETTVKSLPQEIKGLSTRVDNVVNRMVEHLIESTKNKQ